MASPSIKPNFGKRTKALEVVAGMDLTGKTYFVTGANSGIGYETCRALGLHGGHVVMGCRTMSKGLDARQAILKEKPDAHIDLIIIDNSNLKSVEECAREYIAKGWPLHCLILNAGVVNPDPRVTDDGFENTFQTNHLAHFLLVNLLTPLLIANTPSRIVVVASEAHRGASILKMGPEKFTWNFLSPAGEGKKLNSDLTAYNLSKLCNVLHAKSLHERLANEKLGITVNSLHPGMIKTNIQHNSKLLSRFFAVAKVLLKTTEQGAATTVYCAVAPELNPTNGGLYYDDCRARSPTGTAQSHDNAEKLWNLSEEMLQWYHENARASGL